MIDVMLELKSVGECYKAGEFSAGLRQLSDLWNRLPEPKTSTPNAYMLVEYGAAFALKNADFPEAKRWAALAPLFLENRLDGGEVEFLVGKVAFECGEMDVAKENFLIAKRKSRGRMFQGADPKYKALIQ